MTDTIEAPIVPAEPPEPAPQRAAAEPRRGRRRPRTWLLITLAVVVAGLMLGEVSIVDMPYYALQPGMVRPTSDLIVVDGVETFRPEGSISYTTVRLRQLTFFQIVGGWIDPDVAGLTLCEALFGDADEDENRSVNLQLMDDSKLIATEVALEELGCRVDVRADGYIVVSTDTPGSTDALDVGDVIVEVDGQPIDERDDLSVLIGDHEVGDEALLSVEPAAGGEARDVVVTLTAAPDDAMRPVIGVRVQARNMQYDFPFDVAIDSGAVGGNSAGLAFTLGLIDLLTEGELTGGERIATTGTIEQGGIVGPIGGVVQKIAAVRAAGIELFLVPSLEYEEALAHAGDVEVRAVDTLQDALEALEANGGDTADLGSPCPTS